MNDKPPTKPYWAELGYRLCQDRLFRRTYRKLDGTTVNEVCLAAEDFHRLRRHNLAKLGVSAKYCTT